MAKKSKNSSATTGTTTPVKVRHRTRPMPPPTSPAEQEDTDYEVGYRRPPAATRFKRGKSGNPNGRPRKKGPRSFESVLQEVLNQTVLVTEGGKPKRYTVQELLVKSTATQAAKGDLRALQLVNRMLKDHPPTPDQEPEEATLPEADQDIINLHMERLIAARKNSGDRK